MNPADPEIEKFNDSLDITQLPILSRSQLSIYNGTDDPKIYLAIKGYVYDVSGNITSYGPGKSYNRLAGKDAGRLLALNKLTMPLADQNLKKQAWDIDDLNEKQLESLEKWIQFFRKRYRIIGLIGEHDLSR